MISYSARQFEITPALKRQVELALTKIQTILGIHRFDDITLSVFLSASSRTVKAELHATLANHKLSAEASAGDGTSALASALEKLTNQTHKLRSRMVGEKRRTRKAQEKEEKNERTHSATLEAQQAPRDKEIVGVTAVGMTTVPVVVHDFPARVKVTETHIVKSDNAVAKKRMSIEEAVKEMEFRDQDVFVFRDPKGKLNVLYRTREGRLELIEIP
ncbi:MAG: HPF/RaiA family ribosome-associated protein [Acidobacteriaceae bacterium]